LLQPATSSNDGTPLPLGSESPLYKTGARSNGRQWPLNEWLTVNIRIKPGYASEVRVPNINSQADAHDELMVMTDQYTPVYDNSDPANPFITFETRVPDDFKYHPVSRSETNYFQNWRATWPDSILGVERDSSALKAYTTNVGESSLQDYGGGVTRLRWKITKRATAFPPAGVVPLSGDRLYVNVPDVTTVFNNASVPLKVDTYEMAVRRADGTATYQIFKKNDYYLMYGSNGDMDLTTHPPAYNRFQPTGYANIQDNNTPSPKTTWTRFGQVILSKQPIPWPDDSEPA
jgi:hypothetical protein